MIKLCRWTVFVLSILVLIALPISAFAEETGEPFAVEPKYARVAPFSENMAFFYGNGKWGFIDRSGNEVISFNSSQMSNSGSPSFKYGVVVVNVNSKYGVLNKNGEFVAALGKYDYIRPFVDGLAMVSKNSKAGYIDVLGREVVKPQYDGAFDFSEGMGRVVKNDKFGFVDKTGKLFVPLKFGDAMEFHDGRSVIPEPNGLHWGFIDKKGKTVIKPVYDFAYEFRDGVAWVRKDRKWIAIDTNGKVLFTLNNKYDAKLFQYPNPTKLTYFDDGLARVRINNKFGLINKKGGEVLKPKYDMIEWFSDGLAAVKQNGKWGFIDKSGKELIKPQFESVHRFSEDVAVVQINGKYRFINKTGSIIVQPQFEDAGDFSEGLAAVKQNGKWGFIGTIAVK
jgi:hypothetical protein